MTNFRPAYDETFVTTNGFGHIVERKAIPIRARSGEFFHAKRIEAGDKIVIGELDTYQANTAASYAIEYNECPIRATNRCIERGDATAWFIQLAACVSNMRKEPVRCVQLAFGDLIFMQGIFYRVEKAPNRNVKLVEHHRA